MYWYRYIIYNAIHNYGWRYQNYKQHRIKILPVFYYILQLIDTQQLCLPVPSCRFTPLNKQRARGNSNVDFNKQNNGNRREISCWARVWVMCLAPFSPRWKQIQPTGTRLLNDTSWNTSLCGRTGCSCCSGLLLILKICMHLILQTLLLTELPMNPFPRLPTADICWNVRIIPIQISWKCLLS